MSFAHKTLPLAAAAAMLAAACSDATPITQAAPALSAGQALASKGASGGGGGGGSGKTVAPTPPTVNSTGTWSGTTDGPDVTHTYTFVLTQTAAGAVSGSVTMKTLTETAAWLVAGTVNGDTLNLSDGPGVVSAGAQLVPFYSGIVSPGQIAGAFLPAGGSPLTLVKQ